MSPVASPTEASKPAQVSYGSKKTDSICSNCQKTVEKTRRCSRCLLERYCGRKCQRQHWSTHKSECKLKTEHKTSFSYPPNETINVPGLIIQDDFISKELHDEFMQHMSMNCKSKIQTYGYYHGHKFKNHKEGDRIVTKIATEILYKLNQLGIFTQRPIELEVALVEYEKDGYIKPHIDSEERSAGPVAIISFGSDAVVTFSLGKKNHKFLIRKKSMYVTTGDARYKFMHGIDKNETTFGSTPINRGRRYALLLTQPGPKSEGGFRFYVDE